MPANNIQLEENPVLTESQEKIETGVPIDVHFRRRFCLLKILGIYLGTRNEDGTYTFTIGRLIVAYIMWFAVPMITFVSAEAWHRIQEEQGHEDDQHIHEWLTSPIFVAICVFLPLLFSHSLSAITYTLKNNMNSIPTYANVALKTTKHSDKLKENKAWKFLEKCTWIGGSSVSFIMFLVYWIGSIMDSTEGIRQKLMNELPVFIVDVIYQMLPLLTTIISITFLDYFSLLYKNLGAELMNLCQEWSQEALENLMDQSHKVQKSFRDLFEGFLQYAMTVNIAIIVFFAVLTAYHLSSGTNEIIYLVPGILGVMQILLIAIYSRGIMYEAGQVISRARDEAHALRNRDERKSQALGSLHLLFKEAKPVVKSYGGIPFGYGIIPIVGAFVVAYTILLKATEDDPASWHAEANGTVVLEQKDPPYFQLF